MTLTAQSVLGTDAPLGDAVSRLRVLGFCDYFSESSCGGSERVAREVYTRLAAWGADVSVVTVLPSDCGGPELAGVRVLTVPCIDLTRLLGAQVAIAPRLFTGLGRLVEGFTPDVLHANSLHFQTSLAAAQLQRSRQLPLVTTAHIGTLQFLGPCLRLPTALHERAAGRFILSRSVRAIAVAPSVAEHLYTLGMDPQRIDVVANGVDHDRFFPRQSPPPGRVPLVTFVGRLIGNKGPDLLLAALVRLRDEGVEVRAELVGEGPLGGSLERVAQEHGMCDRVSFVGHTSDVAERLRKADVLVRPSLTEGMPLAVLEAMASGVCVVASDIPGNAALVRHDENGLLFRPGDVDGLVAAIRIAVTDVATRRRLAAAGHQCSLPYSWDATARATADVLVRAAAHRPVLA